MPAPPKPSQTDPYTPEPDLGTEPVRLRLRRSDGHVAIVECDERAFDRKSLVLHEGRYYRSQGDDQIKGVWFRLYIEANIIDTATMTIRRKVEPPATTPGTGDVK
jgi:hypothetical protein